MTNNPHSQDERFTELRQSGEVIGKLADNSEVFGSVVEAFRAHDAERFQAELVKARLLDRCRLICQWLCSKHCLFVCSKLCRQPQQAPDQIPIAEWREFAQVTARIAADPALLERLVAAVDREDTAAFDALVKELKLERFCHQLCHWLCTVRCRYVCTLLCPPPPLITEVGFIPTGQINALGYAAGHSHPPGPTPDDNKPAGVGDHPFGGLENIRGVFSIASPFQYKVEFGPAAVGPWTPILQSIEDYRYDPLYPLPGHPQPFIYYTRVPDASGWYTITDMGLDGPDYLTDWQTPGVANQLYYLKLTVRTAALTEFESSVVPVKVDNVSPSQPVITLELQKPDKSRTVLDCCPRVERGDGNLIVVTLQASDPNFSSISVQLLGGCGASYAIVATDGTALSKTYNGVLADTGYPAPVEFLWDPWAAKIDPCCYLIDVRIYDRAILGNYWSGGHSNENWHSITIA